MKPEVEIKHVYRTSYRTHMCGDLSREEVGKEVVLCGWVDSVRVHGKLAFINLRDRAGIVQAVMNHKNPFFKELKNITQETVIQLKGKVKERPETQINPEMKTGEVEVEILELKILNKAEKLPVSFKKEVYPHEETRLRYRYLDLRTPFMQRNILFKNEVVKVLRKYLDLKGFVEVETPYLAKSTPEGSRDFLVPSRLHPKKFYALAQSPQLYKQLLMVSGFDRYYQFARCFRDEDLRADRQPEFTQLDIEMSFIEAQDLMEIVEEMMKQLVEETLQVKIETPFKKIRYSLSVNKYGTDKPDLRIKGLEIVRFKEPVEGGKIVLEKETINELLNRETGKMNQKLKEIAERNRVNLYLFKEGEKRKEFIGTSKNDSSPRKEMENSTSILALGERENVLKALNEARRVIAYSLDLLDEEKYRFVWIINPPLFELSQEDGKLKPTHHPFTAPKRGEEALLEENPLKVEADAYDLVLNGWEVGGGSIRNNKAEIQEKIFKLLGLKRDEYMERYGFLLESFRYGAPPHGGIALGLERLVSVLLGLNSIREVIAFPKNKDGIDLLTNSPTKAPKEYLREIKWVTHLKI